MRSFVISLIFLPALMACTAADVKVFNNAVQTAVSGSGHLSESDIAAGLKEALATGAERSIRRIGRADGFWHDADLRIPLPESFKKLEKAMRRLKQDRTVDEFHMSLNRAAEQAVPEAAVIFSDAIRQMSLADARGILSGADNAATAYFQSKTSAALTSRFKPVVARATASVGATRRYKDLSAQVGGYVGGFQSADLDTYVTERALSGLFATLADEEKKIRNNPAARSSELLRHVFGGPSRQ